jgi:hypothetical protein
MATGNSYLNLDGVRTYVEVPDSADFSVATTGQLTVSAWIQPETIETGTLTFPSTEGGGELYVHWMVMWPLICLTRIRPRKSAIKAVAVPFTQNAVLAGGPDLADSKDPEPQSDTLQEWLETQPWWWMLKERSCPSVVPLNGPTLNERYEKAIAQMQRLQAAKFEPEQGPQPQPPSAWANIGPAHIESNRCAYAPENSGRIVSLAMDPADASHWLITAASGGIWETTDAGGTWVPRTDDQNTIQLSPESAAIAFVPENPQIVYANVFAGLLKSNDGGTTWTLVEKAIFGGRGARSFLVSPSDPNVVVGAVDKLFGSDASY